MNEVWAKGALNNVVNRNFLEPLMASITDIVAFKVSFVL